MKSRNYLIISLMLFVALSIVFIFTKNNIYYYLTIPILIYASFMRYNREKEKLRNQFDNELISFFVI